MNDLEPGLNLLESVSLLSRVMEMGRESTSQGNQESFSCKTPSLLYPENKINE